mmetsp:Transcript_33614/g.85112  ORF Transcript_33614/g.85112 Transcript_33614/m.85112 type:complete len:284 (+) Transcript_33614:745-1596(+)
MRLNTRLAASMVASMSASVCASDVKPASNCEGARYTPSSSMPRWKRPNLAVSALSASSKLCTGPLQKKKPNMPEMLPPHISWPASLPAASRPSTRRLVTCARCSYAPGRPRISSVLMPAVMARGLPDRVPAWYMGPAGATIFMMSARPPYAPTGRPPPMTLPMVVRSGVMPKYSWAQPLEMRKPVMTSSKHSTAPSALVISRRPCRNSLVGGMKPPLPTTGSRMTPAISPLLAANSALTSSRSPYVAVSVAAAVEAGTPGESGRPRVATPEPAFTRKESAWPW